MHLLYSWKFAELITNTQVKTEIGNFGGVYSSGIYLRRFCETVFFLEVSIIIDI